MAHQKVILVVEDDQSLSYFIKSTLTKEGYSVLVAFDGEEAINLAKSERPDLVLLDIVLPKLTGWDVLKYIRSDEDIEHTPVIVISNLDISTQEHLQEAEMATECIVKVNVSKKELVSLVQKHIS